MGVIVGFDQVERGEFAEGTGEDAIERAFKHAAESVVCERLPIIAAGRTRD